MADKTAATGRRKCASARAALTAGDGTVTVNGRPVEDYFPTINQQNILMAPLHVTGNSKKFDIAITVKGGGTMGQVGAGRLAITRALMAIDSGLRPALKEQGFVTRDGREKERKKSGQPGARKRFQFSKR
jgi:small subunit ribosomal protein S9